MKLKRKYATKEEIPAAAVGLYTESGDEWILDAEIDGTTSTKRVEEFRTENIKLRERLEAYGDKEHGGEMTPERVTEMADQVRDIDAGTLVKAADITKKVEERTREAREAFDKDKRKLTDENAGLRTKLERAVIESKALEAGAKFGLRKTAAEDLVDRVLKTFKIDKDGEVVAFESDGKTIRRGADDNPLKIGDFVKRLATDTENGAQHLFEASEGGGGQSGVKGSRNNVDGNEPNPWTKEHFNRTAQTKLIQTDPDKAERLAAQAGVPLKVSEATRAGARVAAGASRR